MIRISKLTGLTIEKLISIGNPSHTSNAKYEIIRQTNENEVSFTLKYTKHKEKIFEKIRQNISEDLKRYIELISEGNSYGAYEENELIGFIISEKRIWNNSLWIEMIQVANNHRGKGAGTLILSALEMDAKKNNFRIIDIETQNTNVPAINLYKNNGYEFIGLNMTLYDPEEVKDETAVFMSKELR